MRALVFLVLAAVSSAGCNAQIPWADGHSGVGGGATAGVDVTVDPPAPLSAVPLVARFRVAAAGVDPARLFLVRGRIGEGHLRAIERGELSEALTERIVPAIAWIEETSPDAVAVSVGILAPTVALVPGETYSLANGSPPAAFDVDVSTDDTAPFLTRVWPQAGASATHRLGIWCGDAPLPEATTAAALAPSGLAGWFHRGAVEGDTARSCVRFEAGAEAESAASEGIPPPAIGAPDALIRLDPRPLVEDAPHVPVQAATCEVFETAFGPGCATVADDRLHVRGPDSSLLWSIQGAGLDRVLAASAAEPFVITSLLPSSAISLLVGVVDNRGDAHTSVFLATTLAPMPHVVINEVLANPVGPEPAQEWVELVNDGSVAADLTGYVLADIGGYTALPPTTLAPGAFALLVNEEFMEEGEYDTAPAAGTLVLRVTKLGKGGLANAGEPLKLSDASGNVLSRFPAAPKPKPGMSVNRRWPAAPDTLIAGFVLSTPSPGRANIAPIDVKP